MKIRKDNTSGVPGVSYHGKLKRWAAYIYKNGKKIQLGFYDLFEDAVRARKEAEMA